MALLSDLVAICAAQRLDSEATLNLFARRLREAGRVSKAGRGRGAAKMTYLDGARFLIACAATDHPERAADAEAAFSSMLLTERQTNSRDGFRNEDGDRSTLDVGLAQILARVATGELDRAYRDAREGNAVAKLHGANVELDVFRSGVSARLSAGGEELTYYHPAAVQMMDAKHHETMLALSEAWERETERFRNGKNLHANLDGRLLRAVAFAIAGSKPAQ